MRQMEYTAGRECCAKADGAPRVHFVGIGGTAMVAGARLAVEAGWQVRGSDQPLFPPTSELVARLGVPVYERYDAANLDWDPDIVVIGNALSRGNPEVEAALERRLRYVSLPEWIKEIVLRGRRPVVIAGTHGKTTTTALTAWLLERAGLAPGYLIGGEPLGFRQTARLGRADGPFVIEGDEYDTAFFDKRAKFFHYLPEIAVVTSIEFDHGDIYPDLDAIVSAFRLMLRQTPASGWLLACADQLQALALTEHAFCRVATYGFAPGANYHAEPLETAGACSAMRVSRDGAVWGDFEAPLVGRHNQLNALAALAVGDLFGIDAPALASALRTFPGVRRRMEVFLEARGAVFIDDFAHHPTAIRETIAGARGRWPNRRLRVLCEPRSNTMVTNRFQNDIELALAGADEIILGPVYRADTIPEARRLDRAAVCRGLRSRGLAASHFEDAESIARYLYESTIPADVVLICSNGAFGGLYARLRQAFAGEQAASEPTSAPAQLRPVDGCGHGDGAP